MRLCFYIILLSLVALPLRQSYAQSSKLSGSLELRYAQHSAEETGVEVLDAAHFTQSYSLLWEKEGVFNKGRLGEYDIALGYEWSWVDSEINGASVAIDNPLDKLLFRGDVLLAPGGLPFQLHLYSQDMDRTNFLYQEYGQLFDGQDYDNQHGIINNIRNGSRITTGLTMMFGEKNGQYQGRYRDIFTAMPRILIDFQQIDVDDTNGPDANKYTDRNLAFVSLNKNKNWFHYRRFTHDDKLDSSNDYETQTFLLGTIDHVNRRQWVDLTNWIQVSTDISYSETAPSATSVNSIQKRYDLNLYADAQRENWRAGSYASFNRVRDNRSLDKTISIPIMANGRLTRDTTWRIRLENQHEEDDFYTTGILEKESNIFMSARLDMKSQSRYMVAPILDLEYLDSSDADGTALRAGVEVYSNPRYQSDVDLFGSYTLSVLKGDSVAYGGTSYWEQQLKGRIARDLNRDTRVGFEQDLSFGAGEYDEEISDFIQPNIAVLSSQSSNTGIADGEYYRTVSGVFIDHRPASRIYNRFELSYDYISSAYDSGGRFLATHNLNYYGRKFQASMDNELILGGSLHESFTADVDIVSGTSIVRQSGTVTSSFESVSRLDYDPNRRHHNVINFELEWREFKAGGSDQRYEFEQLYEYTFWKDRGLLRKIAVLGEEFEYEDYTPSFGDSSSLLSFTLFAELYPTRQTLLGVRLRYEIDTTEETDATLVFLTAGVDFQKFQMEFDYAYGTRTAGINKPERVEHKWEMQVKKTF